MIKNIAIVLAVVFMIGGFLVWTDKRDAELSKTQDCVVLTANYNHYEGNPYSQDAWQKFVHECI